MNVYPVQSQLLNQRDCAYETNYMIAGTVHRSVLDYFCTMADAEETLRDLLEKILDDKKYKPRDIKIQTLTSGGANFTSALFKIDVISPYRDDLKLFAKVAIIGDKLRKQMNADWLFDTERFVYTKLVKIYNNIQDNHNIPDEHRYTFTEFYGCNAEFGKETIVLENLVESGYRSYNRLKSMDWGHASVAVENLAKFHALSFAFAATDPEEFAKLSANMIYRCYSEFEEQLEALKPIWMKMIDDAVALVKEDQKDALRNYLMGDPRFENYNKPIDKPVIVHGDYRMSNIMFRKQDNTIESMAVDYQAVHAGCPATDLVYFIFLGSDEEFRKEYYEKLLDHYYRNLVLFLERLSIDPADVYPRTKFDSDMKQMLPYAVLIGVGVLPIVTVETEYAPRVEGDADMKDFVLEPNDLYAERFRGIVNDCIRLGAI